MGFSRSNVGQAQPVDIQGIKLVNPGEFLPTSGGSATSGRGVVEILSAVQVRDGATYNVDFPDLSLYSSYQIYISSTLDKPVHIAPWRDTPVLLDDGTYGVWKVSEYRYEIPLKDANNSGVFWLNELTPKHQTPSVTKKIAVPASELFKRVNNTGAAKLSLQYRSTDGTSGPTTGTLTIRVIGTP